MDLINDHNVKNYDLRILVEVTKALNESSSLEEVYEIVLEKASRIKKVDILMIYLVDRDRKNAELKAHKNVPDQYLENASRIPYPKGLTWKVINSGQILNNDDLQNEDSLGKAGKNLGPKSVLAVPLKLNDETIGVLFFISYEESKFSDHEIDILSTLGDQISIAISKAKQRQEIRTKNLDLQFTRKQLQELFEYVPVGICRTDNVGNILIANRMFVNMLGYSSLEDLINNHTNIDDFRLDPEEDGYASSMQFSGQSYNVESRWSRKDGSYINVIHNKHAVRDDQNRIFYIENTIQDITVQKNTEKALNNTITELIKKNKYEKVISDITKSISESLELNEVMENTAELIQQNVDGVDYLSIYLVEDNYAVLKAHRGYPDWLVEKISRIAYPRGNTWKTIKERKIRYNPDLENDPEMELTPDNTGTKCFISIPIFSNERVSGCINISSIKKEKFNEGELDLLSVISRQIGISINNADYIENIKKSNNALIRSEEKFRDTFDNAAVGIALVNMNGDLIRVNGKFCDITGYTQSELFNTRFQDITYPDDVNQDIKYIEQLRLGEIETYSSEKRYLKKNGEIVWGKLTVSIQNTQGELPAYYIAIIEDITDRKRYESRLKESVDEKEVLIKEIHHRVKNNLQIISSLIHLQSKRMDSSSLLLFREMYDRIRVMALTHEQLYQSENLALINFEKFISSLIDNLIYSYSINSRDIEIINNTSDINFGINIAIPCGLIVNELLTNSIKYAFPEGKKGWIRIDIDSIAIGDDTQNRPETFDAEDLEEGVYYRIMVTDNGAGLPENFDIHKSESLGIQIVLDLVDQLNGTIGVSRRCGTAFEIMINAGSN